MSTHQIISMERSTTKNSGSPMWRCRTVDGKTVNVFHHLDPAKNSFEHFVAAGYGALMAGMRLGEKLIWNAQPVDATLVDKDGWLNVVNVDPIGSRTPDAARPLDPAAARRQAIVWARDLLDLRGHNGRHGVLLIDAETTGLTTHDEIVDLAIVALDGKVLFNELIQPRSIDRAAATQHIHGITRAQLETANPFSVYADYLYNVLISKHWLGWNLEFDAAMLEQAFAGFAADLHLTTVSLSTPPLPTLVADVVPMFARFNGEWNPSFEAFTFKSLEYACQRLEVNPPIHRALDDCRATLGVIEAMAAADL